jgi:hypothetical protein
LERITDEADAASVSWRHTKALYRLTPESMGVLKVGRSRPWEVAGRAQHSGAARLYTADIQQLTELHCD